MHRKIGLPLVVFAVAVSVAAPATAASEDDYLQPLLTKYPFLSSQQLLTEANRVCNTVSMGNGSAVAADMVTADLKVSVSAGIDIASAAIAYLHC